MKDIGKLQRDVWTRIKKAMDEGDAATLRRVGGVADEMDRKHQEWLTVLEDKVEASGNGTSALFPEDNGTTDDFTGRPIYGVEIVGANVRLGSYKELLLAVIERLQQLHQDKFDSVAVTVRGRGPYFSENSRDLRSAHKLKGSNLFVETNLSAKLIVEICRRLVDAFGHDSATSLRIDVAPIRKKV